MWLIPKDDHSVHALYYLVNEALMPSRFKASLEITKKGRTVLGLKISVIRLRQKKSYCGAHPGPCLANPFRRHTNSTYLEGLDWVGFNAMLNDALDKAEVNCDVFSYNRESLLKGAYYIRRGKCRRVAYPYAQADNFAHWLQGDETAFADYCSSTPPPVSVDLLDGTPGYPCYTLAEEKAFRLKEKV